MLRASDTSDADSASLSLELDRTSNARSSARAVSSCASGNWWPLVSQYAVVNWTGPYGVAASVAKMSAFVAIVSRAAMYLYGCASSSRISHTASSSSITRIMRSHLYTGDA